MNRFPRHYHEGGEQRLLCHDCEQPLSELERQFYFQDKGNGDPRCLDCKSQLNIIELNPSRYQPRPKVRVVSLSIFAAAVAFLILAGLDHARAGDCLLAAVMCGSLGLFARISNW